jgi:hypothetical protein
MASATDFYNALQAANGKLDGVNNRLDDVKGKLDALKAATDAVHAAVDQVNKTLQWGFGQLITLGTYTNQALFHNDEQNDTIICILEHISKNTCELLNEAHTQTGLQTVIQGNTTTLAELYAATHPAAALARERLEALRKQVEVCCPPEPPAPVCDYQPCPKPDDRLPRPPSVDPQPPGDGRPPG